VDHAEARPDPTRSASLAEIKITAARSPAVALQVQGPRQGLRRPAPPGRQRGAELSITADEASLFADARDGRLDEWTFADAALLVSGVPTAERRKAYRARLEAIEAQARAATASARSPFERGAALLKFLHAGPMAKGYASQQSGVSTILDTGTFNCVSSATLFNILARRLGLDARAVEVPDHAFSIVYDGTAHADVETTTAAGFNPARNKAAQAEFEKLTGFAYIPDSHRDRRREVGELGLLAIVYYNHGVGLTQQKRYQEALLAYFRAMSLDPELASAVQNALAVLANWSGELSRQRKFDDALNVAGMGLQLAPQDVALLNNHKAVWSQWADALMKEGKNDEALAILRRAEQAIPKAGFDRMRAWVFIREGEEHIKADNWQRALQLVEPGLAKLEALPREELAKWADSLHGRWADSEMRKGNLPALDIVAKRLSGNRRTGGWPTTWPGPGAAEAHPPEGRDRRCRSDDPGPARPVLPVPGRKAGRGGASPAPRAEVVRRRQARAGIGGGGAHGRPDRRCKGGRRDHGHRLRPLAMKLARAKQWDEALGVYEKALPKLADKGRAENNVRFIVQEWAKEAHSRQGMNAAKEMLQRQLKRFPHVKDMQQVATGYVERTVRDLARQRQYDEALAAVDSLSGLLRSPDDRGGIATAIYDTWSNELNHKGDWQGAVDVYDRGLKKFPRNSHLANNAEATWYQWSKLFMDKKDWRGAIGIYEKALERMPDSGLFKQNLKYCQEQLEKGK
jgi:tetratricopeptide (TPR) repeat protein